MQFLVFLRSATYVIASDCSHVESTSASKSKIERTLAMMLPVVLTWQDVV